MVKKGLISLVIIAGIIGLFIWWRADEKKRAYLVGPDKKVYVVDLIAEEVSTEVGPFQEIGSYPVIQLDSDKNILYIGSMEPRSSQEQEVWRPLIKIDLTSGKTIHARAEKELMEEVNQYLEISPKNFSGVSAIKFNMPRNELYVLLSGMSSSIAMQASNLEIVDYGDFPV